MLERRGAWQHFVSSSENRQESGISSDISTYSRSRIFLITFCGSGTLDMASWAGSIRLPCGISGGMTEPPATALVIVVNADVRVEVALVENVGTRGVVKGGAPSGSAAKQMHIVTSVICCL